MSESLGELIAWYRQLPHGDQFGGAAMTRFLETVADVLRAKVLYLSTSHYNLWLSKVGTYPEIQDHPGVRICIDGNMCDVDYLESWQDGPFFRSRRVGIRCTIEHAPAALAEQLARLKPAPAEHAAAPDRGGS